MELISGDEIREMKDQSVCSLNDEHVILVCNYIMGYN